MTSSNRSSPAIEPECSLLQTLDFPEPECLQYPLNNSQIKILSTNARSLLPKMTELQMITNALQPDIIAVTETWLSKCDVYVYAS